MLGSVVCLSWHEMNFENKCNFVPKNYIAKNSQINICRQISNLDNRFKYHLIPLAMRSVTERPLLNLILVSLPI